MLLLALLGVGPALLAQVSGTVEGHVRGPGDVSVPGAIVELVNLKTGARKETWTDAAGNYVLAGVPPGTYKLVTSLLGFHTDVREPIPVTAGQTLKVGIALEMALPQRGGPQNARRQPQGPPGSREVPGLPGGARGTARNMAGFGNPAGGENLQENIRFPGEGTSGGAMATENGSADTLGNLAAAAGASNSFVLTGNVVDATAPPMHGGRGGRFFRFGGRPGGPGGPGGFGGPPGVPFSGGGGQVLFFGRFRRPQVNRVHGNFFDSYTNSAFDALPYPLNTPSQPQAPFYRELVGFSLGGPLIIPKVYNGGDKTSFFVHFDINRGTSPQNILATVPTPDERQGIFSGISTPIYEPSSTPGPRTQFPGNVITSPLDPAALALLKYIPEANLPGEVQNYHVQLSLPSSSQVFMGRVGRQISSKDNLAVMYFYNSSHTDGITGFPDIPSTTTTRMQNVSLTETHNFSSKAVNNFEVNFNRARTDVTNPFSFNQNIAGELGILGVSQAPMDWGLPSISFTNYGGLSDATPSLTRNQTLHFSDSVIYTIGKHNFEFGGDVSKIQLNSLANPDAEGSFSFTGYSTSNFTAQGTPVPGTGNDFADFLLGLPQTTSERYGIPANYLRSFRFDLYGSDDWRVTNHLTLNLGGRWEYAAPFTEKYGHLSDLALGPGYSTVGVVTGQNPEDLPDSLLRGQTGNVAPRVGLAYRPWISHSLVVRAGYGIFYDESIYQNLVSNLVNQAPFATTSTLVSSPSQILTLQNGFPTISSATVRNTFAVDPNFVTPYAQTWDLMIEQDLSPTYILSVAYIGTRGTHLNLLLVPGVGSSLASMALPFEYDTSGAKSLYNGLRVSLRHFSRRNFSFFLNYTYSKAEDDASSVGGTPTARFFMGGPGGLGGGSAISAAASPLVPVQNPADLNAEWALSGFNPTQSLGAFLRYRLPFGERGRFLRNGGALAKVLSNWSVSDMTSFSSGLPYTAYVAGNASNNVSGLAPFGGLRADATGLPVALPSSEQSTLTYFNTAAFAVPPAGEFGDAGRNTIPGPPSLNFNMALDRLITISREKNVSADIRLATSNTFNTVNYTSLSTIVNSNTFGRVTGVGSMRTVTLSLRLRF